MDDQFIERCFEAFYMISGLFGLIIAVGLRITKPRLTILSVSEVKVIMMKRSDDSRDDDRDDKYRKAA